MRAAVRGPQRQEMAHTTGAVQFLNVVPSDQSALRVADDTDPLAPLFGSTLSAPAAYDASQSLSRPCVEPAEDPAEVDAMRAVSQPTESTRQPADDARCSEEAMHEQHRSPTGVRR